MAYTFSGAKIGKNYFRLHQFCKIIEIIDVFNGPVSVLLVAEGRHRNKDVDKKICLKFVSLSYSLVKSTC